MPAPSHRPLIVHTFVPAASAVGRAVLRGVSEFAQTRRDWQVSAVLNPDHSSAWRVQPGDAAITAFPRVDHAEQLLARGVTLVGTLPHFEHLHIPVVTCDDVAIGFMAGEHFLTRGFTSFVFDSRGDTSPAADRRFDGYRLAVAARGHTAVRTDPRAPIAPGEYGDLIELIDRLTPPIALLAAHDGIAREAQRAIVRHGLAVPEQVAVLGVDNDDLFCAISDPHLSSIEWPAHRCGYLAAQTLAAVLHQAEVPRRQVLPPIGVVTRRSTDIVALDDAHVASALRYIREHACDPCDINDVLSTLPVSRRWLEIAFKKHLGRPPHAELTRVRLERACHLLQATSLPVDAIARQVGYPHPQNFVKTFRQQMNITPAAYRHRQASSAFPKPRVEIRQGSGPASAARNR